MTWTKLSDDFTDQCADLSDAAFRTHVEALVWTMRRETGGYLTMRDVRRMAESPHAEMAVEELVNVGWWSVERQGYRINHHMEHQPEPDVIEARRNLAAERQKRHRRKKAGLSQGSESSSSLGASPDPTRPDPGHASNHASRNGVTGDNPRFWKTPEEMTS
jgi:hypothetical protein